MLNIKELLTVCEDLDWETFNQATDMLTNVNEHNLDDEMQKQALIRSSFGGLMVRAKTNLKRAARELEKFTSTLARDSKNESGTKKTTKDLENICLSHPDYDPLYEEVMRRQEIYEMLKELTTAISDKKDMLIQLSSNRRAETKLYN